ncbi:5'/3'-nucleotidase SurE [Amphibiibacter pelophylacis]|uniref:5'/3'-nucleotidase SurE n=1 Tax=Amphibiibacter pelophylacis TaxID=1799477 RepID=A0ACC6P5Q9_9BURK
MHILISNDDGYRAPGIAALVQACRRIGSHVRISVVAPEQNASGTSNALTLTRPLSVFRAHLPAWGDAPAHAAQDIQPEQMAHVVNGTPADSVHLALTGLLDSPPDLIVSGINQGENMAEDTLYSGTVAAAMEGYLFGVPALAFSLQGKGWGSLAESVGAVEGVLRQVLSRWDDLRGQPWLLNVNMPARPDVAALPIELTRLGKRHASAPCMPQTSPRGDTIYWIGPAGEMKDDLPGTDFHAVAQGRLSVTPLQGDLTAPEMLPPGQRSTTPMAVWRSLWPAL